MEALCVRRVRKMPRRVMCSRWARLGASVETQRLGLLFVQSLMNVDV